MARGNEQDHSGNDLFGLSGKLLSTSTVSPTLRFRRDSSPSICDLDAQLLRPRNNLYPFP